MNFKFINEDFWDNDEAKKIVNKPKERHELYKEPQDDLSNYEYCLLVTYDPKFTNYHRGEPYPFSVDRLVRSLKHVLENIMLFNGFYIGEVFLGDYNDKDVSVTFTEPYQKDFDIERYYRGNSHFSPYFAMKVGFNSMRKMSFEKFCRAIYRMRVGIESNVCVNMNDHVKYKFVDMAEDHDVDYEVSGWYSDGALEMYYDYFINGDKTEDRPSVNRDSYFEAVNKAVDLELIAKAGIAKMKKKYGYDLVLFNVKQYKGDTAPDNFSENKYSYISVEIHPRNEDEDSINVTDIEKMFCDCFMNLIPFDYLHYIYPSILVKPVKLKVVNDSQAKSRFDNGFEYFKGTPREVTFGPVHGKKSKRYWRIRSGEYERAGSSDYFFIIIVDKRGNVIPDVSQFSVESFEAAGLETFVKKVMTKPEVWKKDE